LLLDMDFVATEQLRSAPQHIRSALAAAAQDLGAIDRFELVTGARYAIEERAGKAPPPDDEDRKTLGPHFFRGRDLVLDRLDS
jgi:hypothetical protein